jgi:hypothetical protein
MPWCFTHPPPPPPPTSPHRTPPSFRRPLCTIDNCIFRNPALSLPALSASSNADPQHCRLSFIYKIEAWGIHRACRRGRGHNAQWGRETRGSAKPPTMGKGCGDVKAVRAKEVCVGQRITARCVGGDKNRVEVRAGAHERNSGECSDDYRRCGREESCEMGCCHKVLCLSTCYGAAPLVPQGMHHCSEGQGPPGALMPLAGRWRGPHPSSTRWLHQRHLHEVARESRRPTAASGSAHKRSNGRAPSARATSWGQHGEGGGCVVG